VDPAVNRHLFQRVLGDAFDSLPPAVKILHARDGYQRYRGEVEVSRGKHPLARLLAWATRLPPAGKGAVEVEIDADGRRERWTRHIEGHAMPSRLWPQEGLLCEKLGLVRFGFRLTVQEGVLVWRVERVHALGLPLPARWFEVVQAREYEAEGRYWFDVAAAMPIAGLLVHYRGWLAVDGAA
jgi:hypothetical protein